jgi:hypothetical protein
MHHFQDFTIKMYEEMCMQRNGNFKSNARSDGTWERVTEAKMEK